ncbi:hypothetical protein Gotri_002738, partial [Gossypium trilobum]|nr:hypothetical protein [Gossypium trilobum]
MGLHVGLTRVEIEVDALTVIQKLQTKRIERRANEVAHLLAVEGLKRNEDLSHRAMSGDVSANRVHVSAITYVATNRVH